MHRQGVQGAGGSAKVCAAWGCDVHTGSRKGGVDQPAQREGRVPGRRRWGDWGLRAQALCRQTVALCRQTMALCSPKGCNTHPGQGRDEDSAWLEEAGQGHRVNLQELAQTPLCTLP
eukprot:CAMPEP_0174351704 /NCGR_PEP_ID=MMETSP0811_2-20130205/9142_1 /TAXON_ID=73025 ORGANISM="Eutreptiella gymnastica-like, Strain CCMP1594" /NCGR_SAMPLE_ID=MMETSP0811_2 /ASSEMBLY_ACC=CAM_ASM_000667 /LENGTH=116 /DNA_ID=CAMNT_0015481173 /DNA_START=752 /DNA_END=1098 /DNA_ORIENTATION=+